MVGFLKKYPLIISMILNLLLIVVFGFISTYTDFRRKIVRNKLILVMLATALIVNSYELIMNPSLWGIVSTYSYNLVFAIFVGLLIWYINIWPAGDAKLFMAYSALLPLSLFNALGNPFLSFDLLINTFVPVFLVMFIMVLIRSTRKDVKESIKVAFDPYTLFITVLVILGFLWFFMGLLRLFGIPGNYLIYVIILFAVMEGLNKIVPYNTEYFYLLMVLLRLVLDYQSMFTLTSLYYVVSIMFAYIILRYFVIDLGFRGLTVSKNIDDLEPGMSPAEGIVKGKEKDVKYSKEKIIFFSIPHMLRKSMIKGEYVHSVSLSGLTKNDIKKIKSLREKGEIKFSSILVHTTIPFALFLFLGIVMTILFQGGFVNFIRMII